MRLRYCTNCRENVSPDGYGVDWLLAAVLLVAGVLPGIVYIEYCRTLKQWRKDPTCPHCNGGDFAPKELATMVPDGGVEQPVGSKSGDEEPSSFSDRSKYHAVLTATGIGFLTLIFLGLWTGIYGGLYYASAGSVPPNVDMLISNAALIAGSVSVLYTYFRYTDKTYRFLDIRMPSAKALGIAVLGAVALLVAATALEQVFQLFNITPSEHQIYKLATAEEGGFAPQFLLVMIPLAILVIGPAEEVVYRGLIQKSLYSDFSDNAAVVLTSAIFAFVHFPAYLTSTVGNAAITISTVFVLSLVLGKIYAETENLVVPSLSHGLYNAALFALLYIEITGVV
jgi:membrane protease YdiL (CAAX protease family)